MLLMDTKPLAAVSAQPSVFDSFSAPDCNLAIWQRPAPFDAAELLDEECPNIRFKTKLAAFGEELDSALDASGYTHSEPRQRLSTDARMLAGYFCQAIGTEKIEVRLETVTTDSCRKFHADSVQARLITTVAGSGTQWLDGDDADRVKNGDLPVSINAMATGDVGIFKGRLATDHPAIHRSPPITGTGERRLLFILNVGELSVQ